MDSKSGFILNPKIVGGVIGVLAIVVLAITYSGISIIDDTPEDEIIESANFVTQPSDRKLFDTTIQTQSAFSKNAILHYMETIEMDENGEEFTQIWVEIDTIIGETARFTYLKFSEAVIDEYDDKKLVLIQVLTKANDGINKNYLYVEEYENNRMVKYIEYDHDELFRKVSEPQYLLTEDGSIIHQSDFQLRDKFEDRYDKINFTNEKNKVIVIIPTFTASAYSPYGFYDFYGGSCDETCLTIPITNSIADFSFTSSVNAVKILDLLNYESITDRQLHTNPTILDEYDSVIVLHNEYVSSIMFNAITSHDNVIFLYPNALYAQVDVDTTNNLITLIRGHNYPTEDITNGFNWENENTHPFEYDTECENWEFYSTKGTPNGHMLNCYPEHIIWKDELLLKTLKELVG